MINLTRINARLAERVRNSSETLTVHYPVLLAPVTGVAPIASTPVSPLLGPEETPVLLEAVEGTPSQDPVTLSCLWTDAYGNLVVDVRGEVRKAGELGWYANADALARVLVEDAAVDADKPWGDTVFEASAYVEHAERRFVVLAVEPVGASMGPPVSYYVWLRGGTKQ